VDEFIDNDQPVDWAEVDASLFALYPQGCGQQYEMFA
jgi:hypothetical protein